MASNIQQSTRAFESAESGIREAMSDVSNFSVYNDTENPLTPDPFQFPDGTTESDANHMGGAEVNVGFTGWSVPKRASGFSVVHFKTANFEIEAKGTAAGNARTIVAQGLGQIVNKE